MGAFQAFVPRLRFGLTVEFARDDVDAGLCGPRPPDRRVTEQAPVVPAKSGPGEEGIRRPPPRLRRVG